MYIRYILFYFLSLSLSQRKKLKRKLWHVKKMFQKTHQHINLFLTLAAAAVRS